MLSVPRKSNGSAHNLGSEALPVQEPPLRIINVGTQYRYPPTEKGIPVGVRSFVFASRPDADPVCLAHGGW